MVMRVTNLGRSSTRRARMGRLIAGIAASFAAVTCDLVTAPKPGAGSGITVNYTGQDTLVVGTHIPLSANVLQGTVPIEGAELRLTTSDSDIVGVVDVPVGTDTIIVKKRGQARIRGTLIGVTGDNPPFAEVTITAIAAAVTIDSTSVTFRNISDSVRLRANVFDTNGVLIDSVARWRSLNPAVASIDSITGKLLARASGTTTIRAIVDLDTATVQVNVIQRLQRYLFSTPTLTIQSLNQDTVITVRPQDGGGSFIPHNTAGLPIPTFTSKNTGVATVTQLTDSTFRVSSLANDTTRVRIVAGTVDTTLFVTVGQLAKSVVIQGANADTVDALQDTTRLRARAFDAKNIEVQGRAIIWTSLNTSVVTVDPSGLVTGQLLGNALVTARLDAALDTVPLVVRNVPTFIRTSQVVNLPTVGDSVTLVDTVLNKIGATIAGVATVRWRSLDATIASVDSVLGVAVAKSVGSTKIIGSLPNGAADTTTIAISNIVASVDITLPDTSLASINDTLTIRGQFKNARGGLLPASSVVWRTNIGGVVSVSNGFITALTAGSDYVVAFDSLNSNHRDSVRITVTNAAASLQLTTQSDTLRAVGQTLQYVAAVRNARGQTVGGAGVRFRALNSVARVDSATGLATARAVGTDTIIAEVNTSSGITADTALLKVFNDVVSLNVSPTSFTIPSILATVQLTASATNAVGGSVTGVAFGWSSSDNNIATVDANGLVTGQGNGTVFITVSLGALTPAQAQITVTNAPTLINITLASITLASINDTVTPAVTMTNALGATLGVTSAQWVSDNSAVATVSNDTIIARSRGNTIIRARNPINTQIQDSILVDVTNAPASIAIQPKLDSLPSLARSLTYTATIRNARGAQILTDVPTWTSTNTSIATVNVSGVATAVGIGTDTIIGVAGTKADTAVLRVSNLAASVAISPGASTLSSVGQTVLLTATARNELGNAISGPVVTWQTSNAAVATVTVGTSATNTITAAGAGSATITATVNGVANSIIVTVTNPPSTVSFTSGTVTLASVGDQATPAITLTNGLGVTLARNSVTWTTSDANVFTVTASGVVTATGAGSATLTATSPANASVTSSVTVTVTNAPATLTIAPAGTTTLTSIGQTATLTATVKNAANAVIAVPSPAVTWSTTGPGSAFVTVNPTTGVVTAVAPGSAVVTATAGAATNNVTVTTAPVASASRSTISGTTSVVANGTNTTPITVQLKDAGGANLATSGGTVTMTLNGTGSLSAVTNNNNGSYTATLTAPTGLGSASVSASINGTAISTGDPLVTWIAGAAAKYIVTSSSASPVAGTAVTISAQQADAFNNPVTTAMTVNWTSTGGGTFGASSSPTNGSGIATISFTTSGGASTTHSVTANDGTVGGSSGPITTIAGAGTNYLVTPATSSPVAGAGVVISAQLRDVNLNAAGQSGVVVTWTKTGPGTFSSPTTATNGSGVATVTLNTTTASLVAYTVTATTGGITNSSGTITSVAGAASAGQTTISAGVGTLTSGSTTSITVQARDANGNNLPGSGGTVTLSANIGSVSAVTDNGNGTYSATYTAIAAGPATVSGTINGPNITATAAITVNPGAASAALSTASVPTGTSGSQTTIIVQARDAAGNNRNTTSGVVTASIVGANSATGAVIDNNGTYTITYTPLAAGVDAIAITLGGTPIGGSPYTSIVTAGSVANFLVEATGTGPIGTQTAGSSFNIRITARDGGNNTAPSFSGAGNTVALTSTGALAGTPVTSAVFASGILASQAVTLTNIGTFTLTATRSSGGAQNGTSNSFTVIAGAASAAQSTAVVPAGTAGSVTTITVQARDAFGNSRNTASGTVTALVTGGNTATAGVLNNNDGTYTVTYTPTATGTDIVTIRLAGTQISGSPFNSLVGAGAASAAHSTASVPAGTSGSVTSITVQAKDANDNSRSTTSGTVLASVTGANTATASVLDNNNGSYTVTYTPTLVGTDNIAITLGGSPISGSPFNSLVGAGLVHHFAVTSTGGGAIGTQTAGSSFNIKVTAQDAAGNTAVSFTGAGNTVALTSSGALTGTPVTSANFSGGVLASQAVTITNTGSFTITATRSSGGAQAGTSAAFTVDPGAASAAHSTASGGTSGTSGVVTSITVRAKDANDNDRGTTSGTVLASVTGSNTATATVLDNLDGSYTVSYTPIVAGTDNIAITLGGVAISGSPIVSTVGAGALHHFLVEADGGGNIGTQTISVAFNIQVTAQDLNGNTVSSFTGAGNTVTLTSTGTLTGSPITTGGFTNGQLTGQAVTITNTGSFTITATRTTGGVQTGTSNTFLVN